MNFKRFSTSDNQWHDTPHYIHNTSTDTITTLPADIYANDTTVTVGLKGQMVQSLTPSPTNPIQPQECGERTGNLINIYANNTSNGYVNNALLRSDNSTYTPSSAYISEYLPIEDNKTYTYYTGGITGEAQAMCFYNAAKKYISGISYNNQTAITFTTPQGTKYYRCTVMRSVSDTESYKKTMLNSGTTALPYEPYGYKIPISSANTTTPVYLGEVQSTRRVKKLVLTGEEGQIYSNPAIETSNAFYIIRADYLDGTLQGFCTHYPTASQTSDVEGVYFGKNISIFTKLSDGIDTVDKWKSYLAAQYAAGTPVCIWYVLATPETAVVNEPLRKIGDYADEVSGITIPTVAGANTLSIGTALQPSEVSVNYKGWHPVQSVHEAENGQWD